MAIRIGRILEGKETRAGADVVTVDPQATVTTLLTLLAQHGIGAVVVSGDGSSIDGIVSERDIVRAMAADPDAGRSGGVRPRTVSSIMSRDVITTTPDASIDEVMTTMTESRIRHLPVVEDGRLVGIVSIGDIVKARLFALEEERAALMDYVTRGG